MITGPTIDYRAEQPTLGIRTEVPMSELPKVIPELTGETFAWMDKNDGAPAGAPFISYHVINMATKVDIELGVPVARSASANAKLLEWGAKQGLKWDPSEVPAGDAFGARYESYVKDPMNEPAPTKHGTEVAIRLA